MDVCWMVLLLRAPYHSRTLWMYAYDAGLLSLWLHHAEPDGRASHP